MVLRPLGIIPNGVTGPTGERARGRSGDRGIRVA